jgi:hypothetical protein
MSTTGTNTSVARVTGNIATIDGAGFVQITDRLSRFSKIAGDMEPHLKVEEHHGSPGQRAPVLGSAFPQRASAAVVAEGVRQLALNLATSGAATAV